MNRYHRTVALGFLLLGAVMACVAYASLCPMSPADLEVPAMRLLAALAPVPAYAVLTALWMMVLRLLWRRRPDAPVLRVSFFAAAFFAGALELLQGMAPGRLPALSHFLFYVAGALWPIIAVSFFPRRPGAAFEQARRSRFARTMPVARRTQRPPARE